MRERECGPLVDKNGCSPLLGGSRSSSIIPPSIIIHTRELRQLEPPLSVCDVSAAISSRMKVRDRTIRFAFYFFLPSLDLPFPSSRSRNCRAGGYAACPPTPSIFLVIVNIFSRLANTFTTFHLQTDPLHLQSNLSAMYHLLLCCNLPVTITLHFSITHISTVITKSSITAENG